MKAGAYIGDGKVGVVEIEEPPPPAAGEVGLDVAYCGVCGSDLHMVEHNVFYPGSIMGHEFSATVSTCGTGVDRFKKGDRVSVRPFLGCGRCGHCAANRTRFCTSMTGIGTFHGIAPEILHGGMAPRINVPAAVLQPLPDKLGLEHGALVEPLAVAWHSVRESKLAKGESVVILGAGPIGVALILAARAAGAGTIVVTEHSKARAERAASFGADHVVTPADGDVVGKVQNLTRGGADVVFDAVGVPGTIGEAVALVRPAGRVDVVGACMQPDSIFPAFFLAKEPHIRFSFVYSEREFEEVVELIAAGRIAAEQMISRVEALGAIDEVFRSLATVKEDVKVLLRPAG